MRFACSLPRFLNLADYNYILDILQIFTCSIIAVSVTHTNKVNPITQISVLAT